MVKLFFPEVIDALAEMKKTTGTDHGFPALFEEAVKFIHESSGDLVDSQVQDIHATAEVMIDAGLFHLPFKSVWIEDPFPAQTAGREGRYFLYCVEKANEIHIYTVVGLPSKHPKRKRDYTFYACPEVLSLSPDRERLPWYTTKNTSKYSLMQFVINLATAQADVEKVAGKPWKRSQPIKTRRYEHSVVRIILPGETRRSVDEAKGMGSKRKLHFVSGYIWGKNTRPTEEQRWIPPCWRGDASIGVVKPKHREVILKK